MTVARRQYIDTDEDYWANATTGIHNVLDYHAAGNGVTDDTAALQEAADAAAAADETLYIPDGDYIISGTLTIKGHCRVGPAAELQYTGSGTALELSDTAAILFKEICLPRIVKDAEDHTGDSIGVHIKGVNSCRICIPYVQDFARGVVISGDSTLSTNTNANFLTLFIGTLYDNKINLDFAPDTGCSTNNVSVLSGRFYHGNHGSAAAGYYHIRMSNGDTWDPSNNTVIGVSLEGATCEYAIVCYGHYNVWLNCRFEGSGRVYWGSGSYSNQILFGTGSPAIVQTDANTQSSNVVLSQLKNARDLTVNGEVLSTQRNREFSAIPVKQTTAIATLTTTANRYMFAGTIAITARATSTNKLSALYYVTACGTDDDVINDVTLTLLQQTPAVGAVTWAMTPTITWDGDTATFTLSLVANDGFGPLVTSVITNVFTDLKGEDLALTWLL